MKEDKQEQWLDEVLQSAQGKSVLQPPNALFAAIQQELEQEVTIKPQLNNWTRNWIAAAAIVLGLLNIFAFQQLLSSSSFAEEAMTSPSNYEVLISDYNLYE